VEHSDTAGPKTLELPVTVAGPADVGRLVNEIETIDDTLLQLGIRSGGTSTKLQKTSRLMDQTVHANKLNLLKQPDRTALREFLDDVKKRSPVVHISFSADPGPDFLDKLMTWLRREIHPSVLLTIGLQPNIGAGCIVRTTNKQFDFSLRQDFAGKRALLLEKIAAPQPGPEPAAAGAEGTSA
jgi:hypothetical protein